MSVARVTEVISSSSKSFDDAIKKGVKRATKTLENVSGVWIKDQSLDIRNDEVVSYKVVLKVTFILK
jgi:flavin-binding protein dodecin